MLPYRSKPLTTFQVGVQRLVIILPKEEQTDMKTVDDKSEENEKVVNGDTDDMTPDAGHMQRRMRDSSKPRRSRRLQKLGPEVYFTKVTQGVAPAPNLASPTYLPSAIICLFDSGPPMRVPLWMSELIDGHYDE